MADGDLYSGGTIANLSGILRGILTDYLGTFQNTNTGLWVEPPSAPTPGVGLHCYLNRYPKQLNSSTYEWCITLIQYDRSASAMVNMDNAIKAIRKRFPVRREIPMPYVDDLYPQHIIYLQIEREAYREVFY